MPITVKIIKENWQMIAGDTQALETLTNVDQLKTYQNIK